MANRTALITAACAALALLAACDRSPQPRSTSQSPAPASTPASPSQPSSGASSAPDAAKEKTEHTVPAQGQVDARQPSQRRDFESQAR